jgi:arginase family enzyme
VVDKFTARQLYARNYAFAHMRENSVLLVPPGTCAAYTHRISSFTIRHVKEAAIFTARLYTHKSVFAHAVEKTVLLPPPIVRLHFCMDCLDQHFLPNNASA